MTRSISEVATSNNFLKRFTRLVSVPVREQATRQPEHGTWLEWGN